MIQKPEVEMICISPQKGEPMKIVTEVMAIEGCGLEGDRYAEGKGSFHEGKIGNGQVTLMNAIFFDDSEFKFIHSRRNILVRGVELMWLIGREFTIGDAVFRGEKYCDPCPRPSKLSGSAINFKETFHDRGGLVAAVLTGGLIKTGSIVVPPKKSYE